MSLTCRVQYVDDTDPFEYSANVPEPQRSPPVHSFSLTLPLINQIAGVYKVLRAPHRVSPAAVLRFYRRLLFRLRVRKPSSHKSRETRPRE